jgi:flavin-dependent dehydrogenase
VLVESGRVEGVRIGDKGIDKLGQRKPNYEPGVDVRAKITIIAEGPRGTLSKQLAGMFDLYSGKNPQVYSLGVKELWQLPDDRFAPGTVIHTFGWPLDADTFGGGFIYGMKDRIVDIGFVVGLDYRNPTLDPHHEFQRYKMHPSIRAILEGGKMIAAGAKAIPEGGYFSMPRMYGDGFMIVGDSAGYLNGARLKGIHLGIKSGMLAAEAAAPGVRSALRKLMGPRRALAAAKFPSGLRIRRSAWHAQCGTGNRHERARIRSDEPPRRTCRLPADGAHSALLRDRASASSGENEVRQYLHLRQSDRRLLRRRRAR